MTRQHRSISDYLHNPTNNIIVVGPSMRQIPAEIFLFQLPYKKIDRGTALFFANVMRHSEILHCSSAGFTSASCCHKGLSFKFGCVIGDFFVFWMDLTGLETRSN